jgi:hypothetical protein
VPQQSLRHLPLPDVFSTDHSVFSPELFAWHFSVFPCFVAVFRHLTSTPHQPHSISEIQSVEVVEHTERSLQLKLAQLHAIDGSQHAPMWLPGYMQGCNTHPQQPQQLCEGCAAGTPRAGSQLVNSP